MFVESQKMENNMAYVCFEKCGERTFNFLGGNELFKKKTLKDGVRHFVIIIISSL